MDAEKPDLSNSTKINFEIESQEKKITLRT